MLNLKCNFCECNMLMPIKYIPKYVNKHKKSLHKLEEMARMSEVAFNYIKTDYPEIFKKINVKNIETLNNNKLDCEIVPIKAILIGQFLHFDMGTKNSSHFHCDLCNKHACMFHFIYSNFIFHKCDICNRTTTLCGWCQDETTVNYYCLYCDDDKELMFLD